MTKYKKTSVNILTELYAKLSSEAEEHDRDFTYMLNKVLKERYSAEDKKKDIHNVMSVFDELETR